MSQNQFTYSPIITIVEEGVGSKFFPLIVTKVPPPIEPF